MYFRTRLARRHTLYEVGRSGMMYTQAIEDWKSGFRNYPLWTRLALSDIRMKYRRTAIGPFWITASTGLTICAITLVYSKLLGSDLAEFLPFGAAGIISWYFIASGLTEGCNAIVADASIYKSTVTPYSNAILRMLTRDLIIFAHNLLIFIIIALILRINFLPNLPEFMLSVVLVTINIGWMATALAVITTRYRDVQQIIGALITILFLITPIFWDKKTLSTSWIYQMNPFTYFIDALREPLIGGPDWASSCLVLSGFAVVGWLLALTIFQYGRNRLVFWL